MTVMSFHFVPRGVDLGGSHERPIPVYHHQLGFSGRSEPDPTWFSFFTCSVRKPLEINAAWFPLRARCLSPDWQCQEQ